MYLSEIVLENWLLSIQIPKRYSDNFGIPKFLIPIANSTTDKPAVPKVCRHRLSPIFNCPFKCCATEFQSPYVTLMLPSFASPFFLPVQSFRPFVRPLATFLHSLLYVWNHIWVRNEANSRENVVGLVFWDILVSTTVPRLRRRVQRTWESTET